MSIIYGRGITIQAFLNLNIVRKENINVNSDRKKKERLYECIEHLRCK